MSLFLVNHLLDHIFFNLTTIPIAFFLNKAQFDWFSLREQEATSQCWMVECMEFIGGGSIGTEDMSISCSHLGFAWSITYFKKQNQLCWSLKRSSQLLADPYHTAQLPPSREGVD